MVGRVWASKASLHLKLDPVSVKLPGISPPRIPFLTSYLLMYTCWLHYFYPNNHWNQLRTVWWLAVGLRCLEFSRLSPRVLNGYLEITGNTAWGFNCICFIFLLISLQRRKRSPPLYTAPPDSPHFLHITGQRASVHLCYQTWRM